ncbi:Rv0361 family membrane protein [Micromonospora sp. NPDC003197]
MPGPSVPGGPPPPPPGPGVAPPFAAPPTEGRSRRRWIGLGVGALALVLCCGGGVVAVVGLAVSGTQAIDEQARTVAGDYFEALKNRRYGRAYDLLCDEDQRRESSRDFQQRVSAEPEIAGYQVHQSMVTNEIVVPVDVTYRSGGQDNLRVTLAQDSKTGTFEVCGIS